MSVEKVHMKRSQENSTETDQTVRAEPVKVILPRFKNNHKESAVRAACFCESEEGPIILTPTPIVLLCLTEDAEVIRLGYWPTNEEIGIRVLDALEDGLSTSENDHYNDNVRLIDAMWDMVLGNESKENMALAKKHFQVTDLNEIGIIRRILDDNAEKSFKLSVYHSDLSTHLYTKVYHLYC